jgi:hypothetical protein
LEFDPEIHTNWLPGLHPETLKKARQLLHNNFNRHGSSSRGSGSEQPNLDDQRREALAIAQRKGHRELVQVLRGSSEGNNWETAPPSAVSKGLPCSGQYCDRVVHQVDEKTGEWSEKFMGNNLD